MQRTKPSTTLVLDLPGEFADELLTTALELRDGRGHTPALWEETAYLALTRDRARRHVRRTRE
jgi:hypothetical protein